MHHPYAGPGRQFYVPKPEVLSDITVGQATAIFRVPMPDSRVRCKVSLVFDRVPTSSNTALPVDITGVNHSIWMCLAEEDFAGRVAGPVPTQNIIINPTTGQLVTRAAKLVIPSDAGVMGFSREFVTAGDNLYGELDTTGVGGAANGRWMLYTRYQPDGMVLPEDEWQRITAMCVPQVIQVALNGSPNS
jgi:hypothetical protein